MVEFSGRFTTKGKVGLHYGWIMVEFIWRFTASEKLDCIMDGSWWSSVGGSQQVKSWTALWMDNGTCEWQASLRSSTVSLDI